jgi:RNA polymerase sigma factor (sigma-70 family)
MLEGDGPQHRPPSPPLPHLGDGRHFSWSILDDLDVEEDHRRATSGVRLFDVRDGLLSPAEELDLGRRVRAGTDQTTGDRNEDAAAAVEQLVLANLRLCIRPARARVRNGQEFDDVVQDGFRGLIRAAQKFDPEHGTRFSTYAMFWIRQSMDRGADNTARPIRLPSHVIELQRRVEVAHRKGLLDDRMTHEEVAKVVRSDAAHVRVAREAVHEFLGPVEAEAELAALRALDPSTVEPDPEDPEPARWDELLNDDQQPESTEALSALVADIVGHLPERERMVVALNFGLDGSPEQTLESIGEHFDLTRERVRQIRNTALETIRRAVAVERARRPDFDGEMNLDPAAVVALTSDDIQLHVALKLRGLAPEVVPWVKSSRPENPKARHRKVVRSVLRDLREATSSWASELLFETDSEQRRHAQIAERIESLIEQEPYDRNELVKALADLVDDLGHETIGDALLEAARSAVSAALKAAPPDADALARLLRLLRFLGCSTDPVGFRLALHVPHREALELGAGSRVARTWHYDQSDPEHVRLGQEMHEHGDALGLKWKAAFDEDLDLMIAQSFEYRSAKTFAAVLAGVPICDIEMFLGHRAGRRLTVLRAPFPIPWTFVCRSCHLVLSRPRSSRRSAPTRCEGCAS